MVDREAFDKILSGVYRDNPQWWPYGLKRAQFDESFAVRDPKSGAYCGFTGWQFRHDDAGKPVGYYAVGILPEFRRQGLAKRALQEMFTQHKPKHVNSIKAFIVPGNTPSCELARQLGVPVQHKSANLHTCLAGTTFQQMVPAPQLPAGLHTAMVKHASSLWQRLAQQAGRAWGGTKAFASKPVVAIPGVSALGATGYDAVQRSMDDKPFLSDDRLRERLTQGLFNTAILSGAGTIGRGMGKQFEKIVPKLTANSKQPTIDRAKMILEQNARALRLGSATSMLTAGTGGMAAKDLMMGNRYTGADMVKALQDLKAQPAPTPPSNWFAENPVKSTIGAILAAAGIAGGSALLGRSNHTPQTQQDSKGRIKVTLPTKRPGDIETQLDMPVEQIELSNALMSKVRRDVRKRLRGESEERTVRKQLSPEERVRRANLLNSYHNRSLLT